MDIQVGEEKKELLTDEEREILKQDIKFFNHENGENRIVKYIKKRGNFICFQFAPNRCNTIYYVDNCIGLIEGKLYTLSELGLEE